MFDIIIKNGTVIDGTGAPARKADLAIEKGKIVAIEPNITGRSNELVDATDHYVTPGFIDTQNHSDSYWTIFDQPDQFSLLSQGITSVIMGNCGASLAPLLSADSIKAVQKWHNLSGANINWVTMTEFLQYMQNLPHGLNVGTLVGHATLRRGLVGDRVQVLDESDLKVIKKSLAEALDQGAFGLSMGLIYAHEVNSSIEELQQLINQLKPSQKYLSIHLRSEGTHILESVDEVIELAQKAEVPIKISHLKIRGKKNWPLFDRLMSKLEVAYHQGLNISFDVYPYDTSWSVLYTYLPKWSYEGGRDQILKMVSDFTSRRKILDYIKSQDYDYNHIIVSEASNGANFIGKTLKLIAANQGVGPEEAMLNVIAATNAQVTVFDHNLSTEHTELLCASPLSLISTDGAGYGLKNKTLVHPRCFGTMPRFLRMVSEHKILKWEHAIKKLTAEPAKLLNLSDRGTLEIGRAADVVVFDPHTITDKADYKNPNILSEGINTVLVNGKIAFADKQTVNLNGQVLKR